MRTSTDATWRLGSRTSPYVMGSTTADIERLEGRLWAYAVSLGAPRDDASDMVHDAFVRLTEERQAGRSIENEVAWLFATMHRLVIDQGRRNGALRRALQRLAGLRDARRSGEPPNAPGDIWRLVDGLPRQQRLAIFLRYRGDLNYSAIAQVLKVSESAARSYVTKGLATLSERVDRERD